MRKIILLYFLFIHSGCYAQAPLMAVLDTVIARAKITSMYSAKVNWDSLQQQVHAKAVNAKSVAELKPAFNALLNGLKDMHGRILDARNYSTLASFTDYEKLNHPDKRVYDPAIWKIVNDTSLHFTYQLLPGKTGYLRITGIPGNIDMVKEAKKIRNAVIQMAKAGADKWIVDLRYNGGGNMNPMVSGIAPLIGDGIVGNLVDLNGNKQFDWVIKSSNFIYFGYQAITLPNKPVFKKQPRVAVLLSRWTVSSGELVATCFKGRPNTRFFGEASGSLTTNNNWEIIDGQVILNISTGIYCDRNGVSYPYNIPVDVEMPFEPGKETGKDSCVQEAKKWLMGK